MTFEELMKLKKGDRIVATGKTWYNTKIGDEGTIIDFNDNNTVVIKWDNNVNGWGDEYYGIKKGYGEYIGKERCNMIELFKNPSKPSKLFKNPSNMLSNIPYNVYKLAITCEDGKHTNAKYYINNKLVSESNTSRNEQYDDFDFKTAINNCIDRMDFIDKSVTKGKGLIGRTIKKGQRVRIINVDPNKEDNDFVCLDEYIGKEGTINYETVLKDSGYGASVTFDKEYMNAIDKENGRLCWCWDEIELID